LGTKAAKGIDKPNTATATPATEKAKPFADFMGLLVRATAFLKPRNTAQNQGQKD